MKCPRCKSTDLVEKPVKGKKTKLDHCPSCQGLWFDEGELAEIIGARAVPSLTIPKHAGVQPELVCPRCNDHLYLFCYPGTMTLVDVCKSCGGIWLDDKELQEIHAARKAQEKKIICPKCQFEQPRSNECVKCGVVFTKYQAADELSQSLVRPQKVRKSYAADIPGTKGSLLRFIDDAIDKLTAF